MAYSSSAGAAATVSTEYPNIDSLLLIAPSYDVPRETILPHYRQFSGSVHVMIGADDEVILPQQAFWYYQVADKARLREYVEVPCCGHSFAGATNKAIFMAAPQWAFGNKRPLDFPAASSSPSPAWL
jgi:hypothetical protein